MEKNKKFGEAKPSQIFYFFPNYPPPDHNLGQILNSDLASSYFPLVFVFVFVFIFVFVFVFVITV